MGISAFRCNDSNVMGPSARQDGVRFGWPGSRFFLAGLLCKQGDRVDTLVDLLFTNIAGKSGLADLARAYGLLGAILRELRPTQYRIPESRNAEMDQLKTAVLVHRPNSYLYYLG